HLRVFHAFPTRRSSDLSHGGYVIRWGACRTTTRSSAFGRFGNKPQSIMVIRREDTLPDCFGYQRLLTSPVLREESIFCVDAPSPDRKSTRLNSSHLGIS